MPRTLPPLVVEMVSRASKDAQSDVTPFWKSDSEGVPEEGMYQLACELDLPNTQELLATLPPGFRMVYSVFNWEQSRAGEGFSAGIENSGPELVHAAAEAYEALGMAEEALSLREVLTQYSVAPNDYAALEAAYASVPNPYKDDWNRIPKIVRVLCDRADQLFYVPN